MTDRYGFLNRGNDGRLVVMRTLMKKMFELLLKERKDIGPKVRKSGKDSPFAFAPRRAPTAARMIPTVAKGSFLPL